MNPAGEGGLLGLATSPTYAEDGLLSAYLMRDGRGTRSTSLRPGRPGRPARTGGLTRLAHTDAPSTLAPTGSTATLVVQVTDEMTARFSDEDVHPVYATASLVRHLEQVSRRLLKPHLEEGEEGVGVRVEAESLVPVRVGEHVELVATVTEADARRLCTEVEARTNGRVVGRGRFVQAVVDLQRWRRSAGL